MKTSYRVMRCLEGVFRLDQERTKTTKKPRPRLQSKKKNTRVEIVRISFWCAFVFMFFILDAGGRMLSEGSDFVTGR